ncbi:MAG: hypothetical protein K2Y27_15990 [Xanthobacteraceae bacterium]|nr:hypothetical protein [Xanthobacteraceae bacterium]
MAPLTLFPALLFIIGAVAPAAAQDYPSRPITIVVSTAAGGGNDIMARLIGERMSRILGREIVVENRPGESEWVKCSKVVKDAGIAANCAPRSS